MNELNHQLVDAFSEAEALVNTLGKEGGSLTPSIYDTAMLSISDLSPFRENRTEILEWLLKQQQVDGGWGSEYYPLMRTMPTLAAILALYTFKEDFNSGEAIENALAFLNNNAHIWDNTLPEDIPIGAELTIPKLLSDLETAGLFIPTQPYYRLVELGYKRLALIERMRPGRGSSAVHSLESFLGDHHTTDLVDPTDGVGHSPAATAAWLRLTRNFIVPPDIRNKAESYLMKASKSTQNNIMGLVPTVWPITDFEIIFSLYPLLLSDALDIPLIMQAARPLLDYLAAQFPNGLGMSPFFSTDGDDTTTGAVILKKLRYDINSDPLKAFRSENNYVTWHGEMQGSPSVNAHAHHALNSFGEQDPATLEALKRYQNGQAYWDKDKWHSSWLYTTSQVMCALSENASDKNVLEMLKPSIGYLRSQQHLDGGWGYNENTTITDTSFAVLALHQLQKNKILSPTDPMAISAYKSVINMFPQTTTPLNQWIGKELFHPHRIGRMFELSAFIISIAAFDES